MQKMSDVIMSDITRDFWSEIRKLKVHNTVMSNSIDGCNDNDDIMNVFRDKYMSLYNSVPYDEYEMSKIKSIIEIRIDTCNINYNISINDVIDAVMHLKSGKSYGNEGLNSDHFIHGTNKLYASLVLLFTSFLLHGYSPDSMILGTIIPIPKYKRTSLCDSSNYRAIALSSMFSKVLDWIILMKEQSSLLSLELQFGFKKGLSTTQCTYSLLVAIDYYNYNKSSVFVSLLDASKAFDRINYCKLFTDLLKRNVSPFVLRLLLHMYTTQTLCVGWGHALSNLFSVKNGVKQGGVLSPILFAIYTDVLLKRLQKTGVGCHMGHRFSGALAYADDITLLSPSRSGMAILVKVCEKYAAEYDIIFNSKKSQLLQFRGRHCCTINKGIEINGQHVNISSSAVHLGHTISSVDRSKIVKSAIKNFWRHFNMFMSHFSSLSVFLCVEYKAKDTVLSSDFWPEYVGCRPFF